MDHLKIFISLTRLDKPIGFMLLFWPCAWGLSYAFLQNNEDLNKYVYYIILFFFGSVLMRSAGCIFNDIVDKDLDKKVSRTKKRPLASGKISVKRSLIYVFVLCLFAFIILIQFNFLTIFLGLASMFLAFSYPFMKRITYWPQLFLGLTFNWGAIMSYAAISNYISYDVIMLYMSAIFWTLGYDTIYGVQDISDDEIIGIKSTAIKFKKNLKLFVTSCYLLSSGIMVILLKDFMNFNLLTFFLLLFFASLVIQIINFQVLKPSTCLSAFKTNNLSGLLLLIAILNIDF